MPNFHIVQGGIDNGDKAWLERAARQNLSRRSWVVPKGVAIDDEVVIYVGGYGFFATARIKSRSGRRDDWPNRYGSALASIKLIQPAISLATIQRRIDRVAVIFSYDDGRTWGRPQPIEVDGLPRGFMRPCDPTLVQLDDGRYRLYFTSRAPQENSPATYSAVSSDAVRYTFEPGKRFGVDGETVLDCAVAQLGEQWHYFAPVQGQRGRGFHAVSRDGVEFERVDDVTVPGDRQWLGCAVARADGLQFFGSGRDGIWSATSPDGVEWRLDSSIQNFGADPGVVAFGDGRIRAFCKAPKNPGESWNVEAQATASVTQVMTGCLSKTWFAWRTVARANSTAGGRSCNVLGLPRSCTSGFSLTKLLDCHWVRLKPDVRC